MSLLTRSLFRFAVLATCLLTADVPESVAKPAWRRAFAEGILVCSNESPKTTKQVVDELVDAKRILNLLFPGLAVESKIPLRLVVFRSQSSIREISPLFKGKPQPVGGLFFHDFEGPTLIVHAGPEWENTRHAVYHEYIHFLTQSRESRLPPWLSEGLAELFSTIRTRPDGKIEVGGVIPYAVGILAARKPIPMERLFRINHNSPEYRSENHGQGVFYAQSWLLLHYLKYGQHDLPPNAFGNLANRAAAGERVDEALIQETLGMDFESLEKALRHYSRNGKFTYYLYPASSEAKALELDLQPITEGDTSLLLGSLLLSTRGPKEAYPYLARAEAQSPDNPLVHSYLGYHALSQDQASMALKSFAKAIDLGSESPYTLLRYSTTWIQVHDNDGYINPGSINRSDTAKLLGHLFKSRDIAGAFDPMLYQSIAHIWLASEVRPTDEHMAVVREGLDHYPADSLIGYYLALYFESTERYEEARILSERFQKVDLNPYRREAFEALDKRLAATSN